MTMVQAGRGGMCTMVAEDLSAGDDGYGCFLFSSTTRYLCLRYGMR